MEKDRIQSLDLVKIVAMLMVLMLHVNVFKDWSRTGSTGAYYALAGIAIPLFFMTSGYLMANKAADWKYVARKIWGILRFTLIISLVVYGLSYLIHGSARFPFPQCLIQRDGLAVFWYFGAMILVYASLPVLLRIINNQRYFVCALVCLVIFGQVMFTINHWGFEGRHPWQTFRLHYWYMYFLLGAYMRRNPICISKIRLWWTVPAAFLYGLFYNIGIVTTGIEHYFGSLPCIAYAFITFGALVRLPVRDSKLVDRLSSTFLPVYAFHWMFLQEFFHHNPFFTINHNLPVVPATALDYVITTAVMLVFGLVVMRIPFAGRIFRI